MRRTALTAVFLLLAGSLAGCTNNKLRRSTVAQAMTLNDIQHQQVLQNLAAFAANENALPRHVSLHDGTAQITDNGSLLGQVISGRFLQMGAQRTVVDQWSMQPVTNDVALRLLRVAYRRPFGINENLYSDDLANDFAHEIKKQTYQVDDLRTLVNNQALIKRAEESFAADRTTKKDEDTVAIPLPEAPPVPHTRVLPDGTEVHEMVTPSRSGYKLIAGISATDADKARNKFDKVVSANAIDIVYPGERISQHNVSIIEIKDSESSDPSFTVYREATPLVIELRRQVYETNKDLEDIQPGWLCKSTNKHDIPHDACYTAWAKDCGKIWYVWVEPSHRKEFEDFTLKILNISGLIKEPTVSGATGVKFTPSGNNSAAMR
jgi:hypothetical protein